MKIGDKVEKIKGYKYIGTVVAFFKKLDGQERIIVELENSDGLLHIFSLEQMRVLDA